MNANEMVPCDHVVAKLWDYIDGQLDESTADAVEAHLDICARCFPEYDFRRAYKRFVHRADSTEIPAGVRHRVFAAILEEEHRTDEAAGEPPVSGARGRIGRWVNRWLRRG